MKLSDKREALSQQIMLELNNAFDFAEKAFGHGPEMVLFVTELAAGFYSISFIQENGCDKFYYYNNINAFIFKQRIFSRSAKHL